MTFQRTLTVYLALGAVVIAVVAAVDGERGLRGGAVAWVVCLVPLLRWPHRRVAAGQAGRRIGGKWGLIQSGAMLFRLAWVLGVGAVIYVRFGDRLGVGFWIAVVILYQGMLALSVLGALRRTAPAGRPATDGNDSSDAPGGRL